jgi:hypothetical protein
MEFYTADTTGDPQTVIDSSGRLLVGTGSDITGGATSANIQSVALGGGNITVGRNDTSVGEDTIIGGMRFFGNATDGNYDECARIVALSDTGGHGSTSKPTRIEFRTTASGAVSPTERMRIDSAGNVAIGSAAQDSLTSRTGQNYQSLRIQNANITAGTSSYAMFGVNYYQDTAGTLKYIDSGYSGRIDTWGDSIEFHLSNGSAADDTISGSERMRIDSSGRLLVGTSTAISSFKFGGSGDTATTTQIDGASSSRDVGLALVNHNSSDTQPVLRLAKSRGTAASPTLVSGNDFTGSIQFMGYDGTRYIDTARIDSQVDTTPGTNDMPGRLVFLTTTNGASTATERMRITSDGRFNLGTAADPGGCKLNIPYGGNDDGIRLRNDVGTGNFALFYANSSSLVGSISHTSSATAYNTSSDYRLKENVVPLTGATDRVKQLKPSKFNFIADPSKTVDGFLAHEAQSVVPECVTGTKDAVDDEGNPVYQGIDQSKLVPLLTAALQEALAKIETLEQRLTDAGL